MDRKLLGQQLRGIREARGLTLRAIDPDLKRELTASNEQDSKEPWKFVSAIENGEGNPTLGRLELIARALGNEFVASFRPAGTAASLVRAADQLRPEQLARVLRFAELAERASPDLLDGVIIGLEARIPSARGK